MNEQIRAYIIKENFSIVEAMEVIDKNGKGILFVVNDDNELIGCVTDGDIRRHILKAGSLSTTVDCVMNISPMYMYWNQLSEADEYICKNGITALPIVDEKKRILKIIFCKQYSNEEESADETLKNIPIIIMAGGKGTRLYPYTKILPKPLIPIGEIPILERIIERYRKHGADEFYITVNYKKNMIKSYFNEIDPAYSIKYVEETIPLGTCGSLGLINDLPENPLIVTNCDSIIIEDYSDIYNHHINAKNKITVVSAMKNIVIPYGVLEIGEEGEVVSLEEKPKNSVLVNTGMYIVDSDLINLIPKNEIFHMTDLIEIAMKRGYKVGVYPISEDSFLDMGEFDEMKRMEELLNIITE